MSKGRILLTGGQGFISSHLCERLLKSGYQICSVDIMNKYGNVVRPHDNHPNFTLHKLDLIKDFDKVRQVAFEFKPDFIIHAASRVGGISYFHSLASDLLRDNLIMDSNVFTIAIELFKAGILQRILALSSSMVYESVSLDQIPTPESILDKIPFPKSPYGFSKLSLHFQAKGAYEQYKLPYSLILPFNACGAGEGEAVGLEPVYSGNVKMLMSHILPDLIYKAFKVGPNAPLPILGSGDQLRCYTHAADIARAIEIMLVNKNAINNEFNISRPMGHTVKELAALVWKEIWGDAPLRFEHCEPFQYDVQVRQPDVSKAKELLGFEAEIPIEKTIKEVIGFMKQLHGF